MRSTYRVLAYVIAAGVLVQAASIAAGIFGLWGEVEDGGVITEDWEYNAGLITHAIVGMIVIPLVALVLLIVSFFAKVPGGVRLAAIVLGLVVLQVVLAFASYGISGLGALHGLNAIAVLGAASAAARRAGRAVVPAEPVRAGV